MRWQSVLIVSEKAINSSAAALNAMNYVIGSLIAVAIAVSGFVYKQFRDSKNELELIKNRYLEGMSKFNESERALNTLTSQYLLMQQEVFNLPRKILPFDLASKAYENDTISKEVFDESAAWFSWQKWIFSANETGYVKKYCIIKVILMVYPYLSGYQRLQS